MRTGRPPKRDRTAFGERVYQAREQKGLSQRQIAEDLGIPPKSYANWERREVAIKPNDLAKLAKLLNTTVAFLLGEAAPKKKDGPTGKARKLFEEVGQLPRSQQQRILATVEDMLLASEAKRRAS